MNPQLSTSALPAPIGVIIVSYNTRSLLHTCLQSLQCCSLPLCTVVVDNHSTDESVAMVRATFPHVQVQVLAQNRGFAAATNYGLRWLTGADCLAPAPRTPPPPDYLLLLNPDTVVHPGALEDLVAFLETHPRVGLVGPRLLNPDGSVQPAAFRFPTLTMSLLEVFPPGEVLPGRWYGSWWHGRYPQEQAGRAPFPIDHPLGACLLIRRRVVEQVGLLDERYFMYSEEIEWCWRIRQAGWAIWQVPSACVTHIGGGSARQFRHRMFLELHRSRLRFFRQHYSPTFLRLHRLITAAGMVRAMVRTWLEHHRQRLPHPELRGRLWAYGEVLRLMQKG
ncbi:MAG: glycosyltransferase family 2 protein [Chloroflexaceae bacterium]|nr:glycosyltransferase family 2 protein [Chloroflexaceae bacterium]